MGFQACKNLALGVSELRLRKWEGEARRVISTARARWGRDEEMVSRAEDVLRVLGMKEYVGGSSTASVISTLREYNPVSDEAAAANRGFETIEVLYDTSQ